jgi:hypothetical protein
MGESAERWQLEPIFISSPTLVAQRAFRMFFVTGEIWRDLAWSRLAIGLGLAGDRDRDPLGLAAGWYRASPTRRADSCRHSTPRRRSPSCRSSCLGRHRLAPQC